MEEEEIFTQTGARCWAASKPRLFKFGSKMGRLVLTNKRIVFLSTGKMLTGGEIAAAIVGGVGGFAGGMVAQARAGKDLTFEDLSREGSWEFPLSGIETCEAGKSLVYRYYLALQLKNESSQGHRYSIVFGNGVRRLDLHSQIQAACTCG